MDNSKQQQQAQQEAQQQMGQQAAQPGQGLPPSLAAFQQQQAGQQPQQQQQLMGGLPFALMGASPLQQQLSALSGFGTGQPAPQQDPQPSAQQQLLQTLLASQAMQQQQQQQQQQQASALLAAMQQQPQQQQAPQQPQLLNNPLQQAMLFAMQQQPQPPPQTPQVNPLQQQLQQLMMYQQLLAQQPAMAAALLGQQAPQQAPQATAIPNMVSIPEETTTKNVEWAEPFSGKSKKEPPFPLKLHQILGNPEFSDCITWNPSGRSWRILKPPVFEQVVIPLYFRHAKYASFMRQVNGWGFKRIVSGHDHNSYYHEQFIRENPQACLQMRRVRKNNADDSSVVKKKTDSGASQITDTSASDNSSEEHQQQQVTASMNDETVEDTKPSPSKEMEEENDDQNDSTDDNTEDQDSADGVVNHEAALEPAPQPPQNPQGLQLPMAALAQPNVLNNLLPGLAAAAAAPATTDPSAAALGMLGGMGFDASTLQKLHEALQQRQQQHPPAATAEAAAPVLGHTAFLAAQLQQAFKGSGDTPPKDSSAV